MRHHNANRKLSRKRKTRKALMRTMASSLILRERMTTTLAKAKELRPFVEKLISSSRDGSLSSRRKLISELGPVKIIDKLLKTIGPKYQKRAGGYTRVIKLPNRQSDGSPMAQIELV